MERRLEIQILKIIARITQMELDWKFPCRNNRGNNSSRIPRGNFNVVDPALIVAQQNESRRKGRQRLSAAGNE
jgi:hypothetical protein